MTMTRRCFCERRASSASATSQLEKVNAGSVEPSNGWSARENFARSDADVLRWATKWTARPSGSASIQRIRSAVLPMRRRP